MDCFLMHITRQPSITLQAHNISKELNKLFVEVIGTAFHSFSTYATITIKGT